MTTANDNSQWQLTIVTTTEVSALARRQHCWRRKRSYPRVCYWRQREYAYIYESKDYRSGHYEKVCQNVVQSSRSSKLLMEQSRLVIASWSIYSYLLSRIAIILNKSCSPSVSDSRVEISKNWISRVSFEWITSKLSHLRDDSEPERDIVQKRWKLHCVVTEKKKLCRNCAT